MHEPRREPAHRADRAHHILLGGVARVDDPVAAGEVGVLRGVGRHAQRPRHREHRPGDQRGVEGGRGEREVVRQRQVDVVGGEQGELLERLVFEDGHPYPGMGLVKIGDQGQQRAADGRGESGDPDRPGRLGARVEVEAGGVDGGEDGDAADGQPPTGRGEPDVAADRLDERRADLTGQRGDLLRHGGGGDVHLVGDGTHRPSSGQFEQNPQAARVHAAIVHDG